MRLPAAFEPNILDLSLDLLLPSRSVSKDVNSSRKYEQIKASIRELGLIEPLAISPADPKSGLHLVLDGHLRLQAVRELGLTSITCIVSTDDEGYTYNKRVNRLATVQEHFMILRALERGVAEERLARTLDIDVEGLRRRRDLLDGICGEVVEMLKEQNFSHEVMRHLRKMKPARQIECADLMCSLANFSVHYAAALLAATPPDQLVNPQRPKHFKGLNSSDMARMEQEMSMVQSRFKAIELSYGNDVLNLVLARGYVSKILNNTAVTAYLQRNQPEFLDEFRAIVAATALDDSRVLAKTK
jgi:hypothetical protein